MSTLAPGRGRRSLRGRPSPAVAVCLAAGCLAVSGALWHAWIFDWHVVSVGEWRMSWLLWWAGLALITLTRGVHLLLRLLGPLVFLVPLYPVLMQIMLLNQDASEACGWRVPPVETSWSRHEYDPWSDSVTCHYVAVEGNGGIQSVTWRGRDGSPF